VGGGSGRIGGAVASLASARGAEGARGRSQGLEEAPWHDLDAPERVMALMGPRQFAISRPEDLATILAMIQHREASGRREGLEEARGADALVSMGEWDALTLEVEGIHRYAQGQLLHLPERGRVSLREGAGAQVVVEGLVFFEDEAAATAAQAYWDGVRQQLARRPMLRLLGMASVLGDATLEVEGARVRLRTSLSHGQARQLLAFIGAQIAAMTGFVPPAEAPAAESTAEPAEAPAAEPVEAPAAEPAAEP